MSARVLEQATATNAARKTPPPRWLVLTAFAAVYLLWGSTYLGIRIAIESIPPLLMGGARFLAAGLVLYGVMRMRGAPRPEFIHWKNAAIVGALLLLVGNGGLTWAEQTVPSNIAALIIASKDHLGHNVAEPIGASVLLVAALCWAAGSVFSRHARQSESALLAVAMQMIAGGALLLIGGAVSGELRGFDLHRITPASASAFLYLFLCGSLIGFTAYVWLLQVSTPARVSTYAFVNPLIAVILGRVFHHELLPKSVLLAGALIVAASGLITIRSGAKSAG